jgi:hypothetical protein
VKNPRHSFPMVITIPAYRAVGQLHREEAWCCWPGFSWYWPLMFHKL